jgi:hypothetical protein
MDESPLFARAYDLVEESCIQSERMPRSRRAVLGRRMEDSAFAFHEAVSAAAKSKDPLPVLVRADLALGQWRLCLRLGVDLGLFSEGRMEELMTLVAENGRLLGGWQRKLGRAPPARQ